MTPQSERHWSVYREANWRYGRKSRGAMKRDGRKEQKLLSGAVNAMKLLWLWVMVELA